MESAGVRYLCMSCWRIRNRMSEHRERVRFLIRKQEVRIYPHKALSMWYCVYYVHTETFIILEVVFFKSFQNDKICHNILWNDKQNEALKLTSHSILSSLFSLTLLFSQLSTILFIDREYTKLFASNFWGVCHFSTRKTLQEKLFLLHVCKALTKQGHCKLQVPKAGTLVRNSHTSVTSNRTYHFSYTWKNIVHNSD